MTTSMSIRLPEDIAHNIESIATKRNSTQNDIILEAVKEYVVRESWQLQEISDSLIEAEREEWVSPDHMDAFWARWI